MDRPWKWQDLTNSLDGSLTRDVLAPTVAMLTRADVCVRFLTWDRPE